MSALSVKLQVAKNMTYRCTTDLAQKIDLPQKRKLQEPLVQLVRENLIHWVLSGLNLNMLVAPNCLQMYNNLLRAAGLGPNKVRSSA